MTFLRLFAAFAKVGVLTFGGGYAMIPMLEREIVDRHGWATSEELMDYYAVGQCTPGVIAVNTATFIGYKVAGNLGGIVATLGVVFPSFVILSLIAGIIQNFADCGHPRVRVRADLQFGGEALEGRGEGQSGAGAVPDRFLPQRVF